MQESESVRNQRYCPLHLDDIHEIATAFYKRRHHHHRIAAQHLRHSHMRLFKQGCQELVTEKGQTLFQKKAKFWILLNKLLEKKAKH